MSATANGSAGRRCSSSASMSYHRTLGIAGLGRIGKNVARKARGFDMKIIYSDMQRDAGFEAETGATFVDKATLLKESDFLTLHVPLTPQTKHYIGAAELKQMKKTAVLINAARGPVVDEEGAGPGAAREMDLRRGLDVFENEPAIERGCWNSRTRSSYRISLRRRPAPAWPWARSPSATSRRC
ncbi:MAG: NAD(P)-dependent oxidoreductase [Aliidongia sp.]